MRKFSRFFTHLYETFIFELKGFFGKTKHTRGRRALFRDATLVILIFGILSVGLVGIWVITLKPPSLESFDDRILGQSAKIYDRTGTVLLYDLSQKIRRTVTSFDSISLYIKNATIAIEDERFYSHKGIEPKAILRAVFANILTLEFSQGGSTITQQVVKNSLLTNDKAISRKIKEWILAVKLEQATDKNSILNMYLNESPYGGNIYGVEEASSVYFGKPASSVSLAEAAYLAAIPQSPTRYSPYGKNFHLLEARKNTVLKKMFELNLVSEKEYNDAISEKVVFQPRNVGSIKAPHFVMFVKEYLEQTYGEDLLFRGGFKVITTLNYEYQQKAEQIVKDYVLKNEKTFKAENGAMVVLDPKTGQILAMVGSRDYFDKNIQGNFNVITAKRQPGSSFKPFVYTNAFNKGFLPQTPIFDVETEFNPSCNASGDSTKDSCYSPKNYEGGAKGVMTLRDALAQSRNIPAVKLLYLSGLDDAITLARKMGVEDLLGGDVYGLSLVLGGAEVSPLQMAVGYSTIANDGVRNNASSILKIETNTGEVLEEYTPNPVEVVDPQAVRLTQSVMSDAIARAPIFGANYFSSTYQVGVKTGTTNSSRDAWLIGYTPSITVVSWMGNNDNRPMVQKASATILAPMWKQFMDYVLDTLPVEKFTPPEPPSGITNSFILGDWQQGGNVHSELYWINIQNPKGPSPANPASDPQFNNWETSVLSWRGGAGSIISPANPSQGLPFGIGGAKFISPSYGSTIPAGQPISIILSNIPQNIASAEYYLNEKWIGSSAQSPFTLSFIPSRSTGAEVENELKVILKDSFGQQSSASVLFIVSGI